ncbi:kazal-type serine protease inhibitor domain-containing protein 1-like isoform X2 [Syngnathoides biaculeatus]|uniref:kazal-type serine protease inhibitor domain-containing protein 1-like isoform X2 n=1 Tax=Syngnathoides biaculeatus TaxID=300417 RepID=UPI002ADE52AA|nr:kazal-type serine protease inhibitor domain-containing protein 1-like isoform X2 [Syngnathoides biaculeatus]
MPLTVLLALLVLLPNPRPCRPLDDRAADCGPCQMGLCPAPLGCRAGAVPDRCGCCSECANLEGQACDPGGDNVLFGLCGDGLRCQADPRSVGRGVENRDREDEEEEEGEEQVCVCEEREALCGSDGVTYANVCHFKEAAFSDPTLRARGRGPCRTVPVIKVGPKSQVNASGSHLVFLCEVFAFPMAVVEWRKGDGDGGGDGGGGGGDDDDDNLVLPGDDPHISVQSRGGPLRFELSSWLQIEGAEPGDSGTYRCVARNSLGSTSAAAALGVLRAEELSSYLANRASDARRRRRLR